MTRKRATVVKTEYVDGKRTSLVDNFEYEHVRVHDGFCVYIDTTNKTSVTYSIDIIESIYVEIVS